MNPLTNDTTTLTETTVNIDGKNVNFSNLNLVERMQDLGHFSFTLIEGMTESGGNEPTNFHSKTVTLGFVKADDNSFEYHKFTGIVTQQSTYHRGSNGTGQYTNNYNLSGSGTFVKLDGKKGCNSYLKKSLADILTDVNKSKATIDTKGIYDKEWPYIVQYNLTAFEFIKMLAARFGQWMYYNQSKLVFGGKPSGEAVDLELEKDVQNYAEHIHIADSADTATGFDPKTGDATNGSTDAPPPTGSKDLKAAGDSGADVYESTGTGVYYPSAHTQEMLDFMHKLDQQAVTARAFSITANSNDARLSVGRCINITDGPGISMPYIITEIHHTANNTHGYSNYFSAVPAEVEVPPYTNPWLAPRLGKQPAKVVENEDKDEKRDLIKVRFPWMKSTETTPWIEVPSMYAGDENGGSVWTPEKDEIVLIDFYDHNGERPHYAASLTTDKNKTNVPTDGNHIKSIGTATGRRIEINDDKCAMVFADNFKDKDKINELALVRKDDSNDCLMITSHADQQNVSQIILKNKEGIDISLFSNGEHIVEIKFTKDKELSIKSKGKINIEADEEINLKARNINIKASEKLTMEGTQGVDIKGMDIKAKADNGVELEGTASAKLKGTMVEVTGSGTGKFDGGGMTTIKGGIVMIN
ncbi:MAG: contractile injection system protein, VgrG/Pvc8 family [Chitinophagaceae bacterium]